MLVVAHVAEALRSRVADAAAVANAELLFVKDEQDLVAVIRSRPVSVVVLDPAVGGTVNIDAVKQILRRFSSTPMLLYSAFVPEVVQAIPRLMQSGLHHAVFHWQDDTPQRFARRLIGTAQSTLVGRFLSGVREPLGKLPKEIADAVRAMIEHPERYKSVSVLLKELDLHEGILRRVLLEVGLRSASRICIAGRVANAVMWLRDPDMPVAHVGLRLGYKQEHILSRHTMNIFGVSPGVFRFSHRSKIISDDLLVTKLVDWVRCEPRTEGYGMIQRGYAALRVARTKDRTSRSLTEPPPPIPTRRVSPPDISPRESKE